MHHPSFPSHLCHAESKSKPPPPPHIQYIHTHACKDLLQRRRQGQPQHADLSATTTIYTVTLEQSTFQRFIWNVLTCKTNFYSCFKKLISAKLSEMGGDIGGKIRSGYCVYLLRLFTITKWSIAATVSGG